MRISELSEKQREFLKNVFELLELPENMELEDFLKERGCELYECVECGNLIFHDNSKLTSKGLLCEVCYSKSPGSMRHWIMFKPSWYKDVDFDLKG